ncbi:MAG: YibE/F family protein [Candidatus Saccharibacteria bacterium]|nr:YibE/F family protein [Candidatus Saccharibacteria bacterium]
MSAHHHPISKVLSLAASRKLKKQHIIYGSIIALVLFVSAMSLSDLSPFNTSNGELRYYRATVLQVEDITLQDGRSQGIKVQLLDGGDKGHVVGVTRNVNFGDATYKHLPVGSELLLTKDSAGGSQYLYGDRWHMPGVAALFLILLVLVIIVGGWRGVTSVLGLVISIGILSVYVLPQILSGYSAYAACIQGALMITVVSVYVAHGFSRRTTMALIGSVVTLFIIVGLVALATYLTGISEVIDENTMGILYGSHPISLGDLLTGGIVIASLGVLYDITTSQAAAVDEIYKANKKQSFKTLFGKGLSVGREHVAALVNTLALVYVGVALPSIVITSLYNHAPLLVIFNDETIIEEVVRTCVASIGMLFALPITTALAAYVLPKWYATNNRQLMKRVKILINW